MPPNFGHDEVVLLSVAGKMRDAAAELDHATSAAVTAPDAGISSGEASQAIGRVINAGVVIATVLEKAGHSVDVAKGTYAHIENTNEGMMRFIRSKNIDFPPADSGPLLDACNRSNDLPRPGPR